MLKSLVATAACTCVISSVHAQDSPLIFRAATELVQVDAVVTDGDGTPVRGLVKADFEILEDGRRQELEAATFIDLQTGTRADRLDVSTETDVRTNERDDGRIYLLVLDDRNIAPENIARARAAARLFLERYFQEGDQAAVTFASGREDGQEFTPSRTRLLEAVERLLVPANRMVRARPQSSIARLETLAAYLGTVAGRRKALLFFSEGIRNEVFVSAGASSGMSPLFGADTPGMRAANADVLLDEVRRAVAAAVRANVVIYPIDPQGLPAPTDLQSVETATGVADAGLAAGVRAAAGGQSGRSSGPVGRLDLSAQNSLRWLALDTGGTAIVNRNEFGGAFERIVRETSGYYLLSYRPSNARRAGRFRRIQVRVTRPSVNVRARSGYVEPLGRERAPTVASNDARLVAAAAQAAARAIPLPGLPLRMAVAANKNAQGAVLVMSIEIDTRDVSFQVDDDQGSAKLQLVMVVTDALGSVVSTQMPSAVLRVPVDKLVAARTEGFRFVVQAQVPQGRFQVRVGGAVGDRVGSVVGDIEIGISAGPLSMGRITLASAALNSRPTAAMPPVARGAWIPTAERSFASGDTLAVAGEVYLGDTVTGPVSVEVTLTATNGDVSARSTQAVSGDAVRSYTMVIPLAVSPGIYTLTVAAGGDTDRRSSAPAVLVSVR